MARPARLGRPAGEVHLLAAVRGDDVDLTNAAVGPTETHRPGVVAAPAPAEQREVVDAQEALGLAERVLRGLDLEGIGGAASVALELDAPGLMRLDQPGSVARLDAPVVERLRLDDDVAREAVAADVRRLPDPVGVHPLAQSVVDGHAVLGAAAVALPVRADDEERVVERDPGHRAARQRPGEVEPAEIVEVVDLELEEALRPGVRRPEPDLPAGVDAALGLLDEEQAGRPEDAQLLAEMGLELVGEETGTQDVAIPEAAILEHDPAVDPARRRGQRFGVGSRDGGAERTALGLRPRLHAHCHEPSVAEL